MRGNLCTDVGRAYAYLRLSVSYRGGVTGGNCVDFSHDPLVISMVAVAAVMCDGSRFGLRHSNSKKHFTSSLERPLMFHPSLNLDHELSCGVRIRQNHLGNK